MCPSTPSPENGLSSLTLGGEENSRDVAVAGRTAYRQLSGKQKHRMLENLRELYPVQFQICDTNVDPARWLKSHEICQTARGCRSCTDYCRHHDYPTFIAPRNASESR